MSRKEDLQRIAVGLNKANLEGVFTIEESGALLEALKGLDKYLSDLESRVSNLSMLKESPTDEQTNESE